MSFFCLCSRWKSKRGFLEVVSWIFQNFVKILYLKKSRNLSTKMKFPELNNYFHRICICRWKALSSIDSYVDIKKKFAFLIASLMKFLIAYMYMYLWAYQKSGPQYWIGVIRNWDQYSSYSLFHIRAGFKIWHWIFISLTQLIAICKKLRFFSLFKKLMPRENFLRKISEIICFLLS